MVKPWTFEEARSNPKWKGATKEEIQAQVKNETWNLMPLPAIVKPISCKWVYKNKTKPDGLVERYKVPLVAQGFSLEYGQDYDETFSPIAKIMIVRVHCPYCL
ncbi:hypothetical protein AAC387_Pa08g1149 [Persea americana]